MQFLSLPDYSIKEKSKAKQNKENLHHRLAGSHIYSELSGVFPNRRTKGFTWSCCVCLRACPGRNVRTGPGHATRVASPLNSHSFHSSKSSYSLSLFFGISDISTSHLLNFVVPASKDSQTWKRSLKMGAVGFKESPFIIFPENLNSK